MSTKFQDAHMYSPNSAVFAHHSSDDDGDHAVFCFCGNEVEPDEEGDIGIYCSTACARKDALQALSSNYDQTSLPSSNSVPPGSSSYFESTRPPVPSTSCPNSLASNPLGRPFFHQAFSENNMPGLSPALSSASSMSSSTLSEGMSSHYRRMEKERVALQRQRKKERDEAEQAAAHTAAMEILQKQRRIRQQRAEYHQRSASSLTSASSKSSSPYTCSITTVNNNNNPALPPCAPLSRNNTASSTSSTQSRYISTHPSRAKTPDLVHHGRNESLGSNTSSISSAASVAWGWGSRPGWGSQSREDGEEDMDHPNLIREEDEELEDDGLPDEHHQLQLNLVDLKPKESQMKRSKANLSIVNTLDQAESQQNDRGGLRMGALLDDILDMERGFTVGGLGSPRSNVNGQFDAPSSPYAQGISPRHPINGSSTPRTHTHSSRTERPMLSTPTIDADVPKPVAVPSQPLSTSASTQTLRTPDQQIGPASKTGSPHLVGRTQGKLKRPFVSTPPSSPHLAVQTKSYVSRGQHLASSLSSSSMAPSTSAESNLASGYLTNTPPSSKSCSISRALNSRPYPRLPSAPVSRPRRTTLSTNQHAHHLGPAHRRSASTPFNISVSRPSTFTSTSSLSPSHALSPGAGSNSNKKPKHRRSFSANEALGTAGWLEDSSSVASPLPPLPVIYSRPRTLVYSPEDPMGDQTVVNSWSPSQSPPKAGGLKLGWELPLGPPPPLDRESDVRNSRSTIQPSESMTSSLSGDEGLNLAPPLMLGSDQESSVFMGIDEGRQRGNPNVGKGVGEGVSAWTRSGERLRAVLGWGDRDGMSSPNY